MTKQNQRNLEDYIAHIELPELAGFERNVEVSDYAGADRVILVRYDAENVTGLPTAENTLEQWGLHLRISYNMSTKDYSARVAIHSGHMNNANTFRTKFPTVREFYKVKQGNVVLTEGQDYGETFRETVDTWTGSGRFSKRRMADFVEHLVNNTNVAEVMADAVSRLHAEAALLETDTTEEAADAPETAAQATPAPEATKATATPQTGTQGPADLRDYFDKAGITWPEIDGFTLTAIEVEEEEEEGRDRVVEVFYTHEDRHVTSVEFTHRRATAGRFFRTPEAVGVVAATQDPAGSEWWPRLTVTRYTTELPDVTGTGANRYAVKHMADFIRETIEAGKVEEMVKQSRAKVSIVGETDQQAHPVVA